MSVKENTTTPTTENFDNSETSCKFEPPTPLGEVYSGKICECNHEMPSIPRIAKFEKVSYEQFKKDLIDKIKMFEGKDEVIKEIYDSIKLPKRATKQSAGYDFFAPFPFKPQPDSGLVIPTGIRCKIQNGWVLKLYPRSGQGFKYGLHLYNSTGIIDGDYYSAKNEGHIMAKLTVKDPCDIIEMGSGFCQGIFTQFGITLDDEVDEVRVGGFGSTSK